MASLLKGSIAEMAADKNHKFSNIEVVRDEQRQTDLGKDNACAATHIIHPSALSPFPTVLCTFPSRVSVFVYFCSSVISRLPISQRRRL